MEGGGGAGAGGGEGGGGGGGGGCEHFTLTIKKMEELNRCILVQKLWSCST